jgi:hypothetical protein
MFSTMSDCVDLFCQVVDDKAEKGEAFDIYASFQALTLDVIGRCALAMNIDCQTNSKVRHPPLDISINSTIL